MTHPTSSSSFSLSPPPPPSIQALHLVSALSNPEPVQVHVQALKARDEAFSANPQSYTNLCIQLAYCLVGCDTATHMLQHIHPTDLQHWQTQDPIMVTKLQQSPALWIPFGQTAGLILKNALVRPPINRQTGKPMMLLNNGTAETDASSTTQAIRQTLLYAVMFCRHVELRNVASTVIATTAVSSHFVQPPLHVTQWKTLVPIMVQYLQSHLTQSQQAQQQAQSHPDGTSSGVEGVLSTIQKMMEDGPSQFHTHELDQLIPVLLQYLTVPTTKTITTHTVKTVLQTFVAILSMSILPAAFIRYFEDYLTQLSNLATMATTEHTIQQWVCRSIVTVLQHRTEYLHETRWPAVTQFMVQATTQPPQSGSSSRSILVALEACEFWLSFATLDESALRPDVRYRKQCLFGMRLTHL
jgi:transportin-1